MGIPDGERRRGRQQCDREYLRPSSQTLSRDRWGKHVDLQLPEGRGEGILTPSSTYTIAA